MKITRTWSSNALTCLGCFSSMPHRIVILPAPACVGEPVTLFFLAKSSTFKRICHPACPGLPWNRSEAQWRDLLFLFCPSDLTVPPKSHYSPLCHPEGRRGICSAPRLPHKGPRSVSSPTESRIVHFRGRTVSVRTLHGSSFSPTSAFIPLGRGATAGLPDRENC